MNATRTLVDRPVPSAGKVWEPALQEDVRAAEALPSRRVVTLPARCSTGPRPPTRLWPDTCTSGPERGVGDTHSLGAGRRSALLDTNPQGQGTKGDHEKRKGH